jgi:hypothetical protein
VTAADARQEEMLLRAEEPEQVRLRDARARGDGLRRRAGQTAARELGDGDLEDRGAALLGGHAALRDGHG